MSELLSAVIPSYDELPSNENGDENGNEAALVARYETAIEVANLAQTGLVSDADYAPFTGPSDFSGA